ncbi:RNA-binding protein FXR1-like [Anomaloglossus baeobatrachus]|uniref:RNA-binding protein FXR1-like n=1 Tax=Anomaloglossus baeobatrachus TaxID=238106 RepID=UPI003F504DD0
MVVSPIDSKHEAEGLSDESAVGGEILEGNTGQGILESVGEVQIHRGHGKKKTEGYTAETRKEVDGNAVKTQETAGAIEVKKASEEVKSGPEVSSGTESLSDLPGKETCPFFKCMVDVPEDLREACAHKSMHEKFKKAVGACEVYFAPETCQLVVCSASNVTKKRVAILSDMHLQCLRTKWLISAQMEEDTRRLECMKQLTAEFQEVVVVKKSLIGLALRALRRNIQQAKKVPGITAVELEEHSGTFQIYGKTEEAVKTARKLLDFVEEVTQVPRELVKKLIGRNGRVMQEMVDASDVMRVRLEVHHKARLPCEVSMVPCVMVGTKECVENVRVLLEYRLGYLEELKQMDLERQKIAEKLCQVSVRSRPLSGQGPEKKCSPPDECAALTGKGSRSCREGSLGHGRPTYTSGYGTDSEGSKPSKRKSKRKDGRSDWSIAKSGGGKRRRWKGDLRHHERRGHSRLANRECAGSSYGRSPVSSVVRYLDNSPSSGLDSAESGRTIAPSKSLLQQSQ